MYKIEEKARQAWLAGVPWDSGQPHGHTQVRVGSPYPRASLSWNPGRGQFDWNGEVPLNYGVPLVLHGNVIAWRPAPEFAGVLLLRVSPWDTATTRRRLRNVVGVGVRRWQGRLLLEGRPWDGEWTAYLDGG